jgi:hypothetical protein
MVIKIFMILLVGWSMVQVTVAQAQLKRIKTNLQNPRGVAVLPDGRLVVAQAGTGFSSGDDDSDNTGKLSLLDDLNGDGDYDDVGELVDIQDKLPDYNILYHFNPGRDEIVGIGDVIALDDGRIFYTLDDNFQVLSIVELTPDFERVGNLLERPGSMNSIVYDEATQVIYVAESTINAIGAVTLEGDFHTVANLPLLAHNQQAVPSGIAIDATTGDLIVALFSGQLWVYYGEILSFMVGDAKVIRVNPQTGDIQDEITELTAAVDVVVDEYGNIYVAEMTTQWATTMLNQEFDLFDPDSPPDAGGYARFSGRVTLYPADDSDKIVLADNLDQPTNLSYHEGVLYISTGQGTPNRPIWGDNGYTHIVGEIYTLDVQQ